MAAGSPPAPYAGKKNPFPWTDSAAQTAGQSLYKQTCLGCHGVGGDGMPQANFSKAAFSQDLQASPDYYFWALSEGNGGMPSFKSSLSEQQRWQLLTYISTISASVAAAPTAPAEAAGVIGSLSLTAPDQATAGQAVTLTANFVDEQSKPVANVPVKFFINVELFTSGLADIGQAVTNAQGVAVLQYTPHQDGQLAAVAQYGTNEARANVSVVNGVVTTYQSDAGLHFPQVESGIIYPKSVLDLGDPPSAPMPAFRLPGGIFSWLFILVGTLFMIWFTYFRVMYQIFSIPITGEIRDINTRLIPTIGLILVTIIGIGLILKLLISPYTHLHIPLS
jgi:mono/diheme cytochrome c family protein